MPKLKVLSGDDLIKIFCNFFGFSIKYSKGSHFRLTRNLLSGTEEILTVPRHKEIDRGTLAAIYRQASEYIPTEELKPHFYHP
jgi:predicted RNA binding protein YcfA (HicA-like mRNA interferase family)